MTSTRREILLDTLANTLGDKARIHPSTPDEVCVEVDSGVLLDTLTALRDGEGLRFEMLMDVAGVDYLGYGEDEWRDNASSTGFGRAVDHDAPTPRPQGRRFAVVYHLLSVALNQRLRVRTFCPDDDFPRIPSVVGVWSSANWFEREAFDLFGILFAGHPDLRRLLTDYGFIGHPFRKDFPLSGNVEVIFDPAKGRVVYQPVTITPRTLVPKVIRQDNRYDEALLKDGDDA